MHVFERIELRCFVLCALKSARRGKRLEVSLADWLCKYAELIGGESPTQVDPAEFPPHGFVLDAETSVRFAPLLQILGRPQKAASPSSLERRLAWLCTTLDLSPADAAILKLAVRVATQKPVRRLAQLFTECNRSGPGEVNQVAVARLTSLPARTVERRLAQTEPLRLLGLIEDRGGGDFIPSSTVLRIARLETSRPERLWTALIGRPDRTELAWEDFDHLGDIRALAERLLGAALAKREKGVNVLLYGEPGTGKTEFAKSIAARIRAQPIFVGEAAGDEDTGEEPTRAARIAAFALARALAGRAGRTLIVMDEADDVFTGVDEGNAGSRRGSKVFMNRLVESTEAPTLWITNHPERLGPAVMRRMALATRFPEAGERVRRRVLERSAARRRLRMPAGAIEALAAIPASPAVIDMGLRVAKLTRGKPEDAVLSAGSILQVMNGSSPLPPLASGFAFDPLLSAADQDLAGLGERVVATRDTALSFCLHGLPGTGKSAFARHLAERLDREVIEKRASDLLSMWVGGTEKAIALAFQEAADRRAMLILDEADSLLRDRAGAQAGWEVTRSTRC